MAKFLVYVLPVPGHALPMLGVVRRLVERGHDVVCFTGRRFAERVTRLSARFLPIPEEIDFDYDRLEKSFPGLTGLTGLDSIKYYIKHMFLDPIPAQVQAIRPFVERFRPDVFLTDFTIGPAEVIHATGGPPYAVLNVSAMSLSSRDTAPFGTGLPPSRTWLGRLRNRFLYLIFQTILLHDVARHTNKVRRQLGLPPRRSNIMDGPLSPYLYLQTTVPSFEYPRTDLPPQLHFVGPVVPDSPAVFEVPPWWGDLQASRKVVLVSQGTIATNPEELLIPTIRALADQDALVVATTGIPPAELPLNGPVPANVRLAQFIPYDRLLPSVSVMITNAGYGGVQCALAAGVPLIGAGDSEEKMEICNRIEWSGVGINLRTRKPGSHQLRQAVRKVLDDPQFGASARRFQQECAFHTGSPRAVGLLETLAQTGRPVLRSPR